METEHSPFPTEETLAAYIDGRLDEATRARVTEHLAECSECFDVVMAAQEMAAEKAAAQPAEVRRFPAWGVAAASALAAAAIVAVIFLGPIRNRFDSSRSGTTSLADALPAFRPSEARIGELPYRPLQRVKRGESDEKVENWRLYRAVDEMRMRAASDPSPANLHALAVGELLMGKSSEAVTAFRRALGADGGQQLEDAIARNGDAALLADASGALYAAGSRNDDPQMLSAALAAADRALALDPHSATAAFNRALILESLAMRDDAIAAWRTALRNDATSPWAEEARQHLRRLTGAASLHHPADLEALVSSGNAPALQRAIDDDAGAAQTYCEDTLFPALAQRADERHLAAARLFGEQLTQRAGDPFVADAFANYRRVSLEGGAGSARLRSGLAAFAAGRQAYGRREIGAALAAFQNAERDLAAAGSPFATLAVLNEASCAFYENRYEEVAVRAQRVLHVTAGQYHSIRGRAQWLAGLADVSSGEPDRAIAGYAAALEEFRLASDVERTAAAASLLAEAYEYVGDEAAAWQYRRDGLRAIYTNGSAFRLHMILGECLDAALHGSRRGEAAVVADRLLAMSRQEHDAELIANTYLLRAKFAASVGDPGGARASITLARNRLAAIAEPAIRMRTATAAALTAAQVAAPSTAGLRDADEAIRFFDAKDNDFQLSEALAARARIVAALGDLAAAEADLSRALSVTEAQRRTLTDGELRSSILQARQGVFDLLVKTLWLRGQPRRALDTAERAHSDAVTAYETGSPRLRPLTVEALPAANAWVEYFVGADAVYVWIVDRNGVNGQQLRVTPAALDAAIGALHDALDRADADPQPLLRTLYEATIAPLEPKLAGRSRLVVVPDKGLWNVPFAALLDRQQRPLVERFAISKSPCIADVAGPTARVAGAARAVIIRGSASGDDGRTLRAASREIGDLSSVYGDVVVVDGQAGRAALLEAMRDAGAIHVVAHAIADRPDPLVAGIEIGRDAGGAVSMLYARDVAHARLLRRPLVFLNACSTARSSSRHFGIVSIASAFLAAGASSVVGTLWDIDDATAGALAVDFHRRVHQGATPAEAMRATQLSALHSPDSHLRSPSTWAAFDVITRSRGETSWQQGQSQRSF